MSESRPFRRGRPTLEERVAGGPGVSAGTRVAADPASGPRHCWVVDDPRWPGRRPALLLEWVRDDRGWVGRVALAPGAELELVVAHVPARHLDAER